MEAAQSRPCQALRLMDAKYYEGMRHMQRMDGSKTGGDIRALRPAQAARRCSALPPFQLYRATK